MTIVTPKPNLIDRLLRILGKKRSVTLYSEPLGAANTQTYYAPKKESILKALLRPSGKSLPEGTIDIFTLQLEDENPDDKAQPQIWIPFTLSGLISQELAPVFRHR